MGGPLIVVPVSALAAWRGCTESGVMVGDATAPDDYDRACAVDDLAGVIAVGENGAQALVLADEPATSCYLPERRAFLRWPIRMEDYANPYSPIGVNLDKPPAAPKEPPPRW
ncbi:Imm21 family immunity protein [Streptomyces sp. NPDC059374]|uniref:Imm21 family immunity protein n=1 Tax=Streptomyces sp. NPDC059374 TaxID=3346814 RepID=UPI0036BD6740